MGPWLDVLYAGLSKLQSEAPGLRGAEMELARRPAQALAELAAALHGRRLPLGRQSAGTDGGQEDVLHRSDQHSRTTLSLHQSRVRIT